VISVFFVIGGHNKRSIRNTYVASSLNAKIPKPEPQETLSTAEVLDIVKQEQENFLKSLNKVLLQAQLATLGMRGGVFVLPSEQTKKDLKAAMDELLANPYYDIMMIVLGQIPGWGEPIDFLDTLLDLYRRDYFAARALFRMIPVVGNVAGAAELALAVRKAIKKGKRFTRQAAMLRDAAYKQFKDKINTKTVNHIFKGEFNKRGEFTGVHHKKALKQGVVEIVPGTKQDLGNGVYMAKVRGKDTKGNWTNKTDNEGYSTFFPDSWDEERTLKEIAYAFGNRISVTDRTSQFIGKTTEGIQVFMQLDSNGKIVSAFPNFPRPKR
jgi:hypothetical protein